MISGAVAGIIYCAQNKLNGKVYIGQTTESFGDRKCKHRNDAERGRDSHFGRALRKYGLEGFDWKILCPIEAPTRLLLKEHLNIAEQIFIKQYDSMNRNKGYNSTNGGDGSIGFKHKESSKKKMSKSHTGLTFKHTKKRRGVLHTEKAKKKISIAKMGERNPNYGKHPSLETRRKQSESNKGKHSVSSETRKKMSEGMKIAWKGRKAS